MTGNLEFRVAWDKAVELAMERLLEESYRRAVDGVEEPVVQGGKVVWVRDPDTGEERRVQRQLSCPVGDN